MTFVYPQVQTTIAGGATEAKQDVIITELQSIEAETTSIDGKITAVDTDNVTVISSALPAGAATESSLSSIDGKVATETTLSSIDVKVATETTLSALNAKVTAVDTGSVTVASSALPTGASTSANQATANASLSAIEADIDALNARLAGNLVPETFDYIAVTYVAAGNGVGEIETVTYRTGGAAGSLVATLTLAYDGSNRLASVTRS